MGAVIALRKASIRIFFLYIFRSQFPYTHTLEILISKLHFCV